MHVGQSGDTGLEEVLCFAEGERRRRLQEEKTPGRELNRDDVSLSTPLRKRCQSMDWDWPGGG